ncbi:PREDICTED: nucleolar protein 56 [Dinoponera quadriceps]|uniref:Nucleolar protein 56 n=1 Tax=Dinoponera quadriceps TaxID=609295 RepID=A0A6P3WXV6_DINQU|nr:PREDICTED: nucleolar protein 56 [Dinoponera quadriceps]
MKKLFILFEHASGYAVFRVKEFEEIGMLLPQVEASVTDLSRFRSIVSLVGFSAFKTAVVALENINCISEGVVPPQLQIFLDSCVPKSEKNVVLGVSDPKLGANITEALGIKCDHVNGIPEIIRGIRQHFHHLVQGLTAESASIAQLGLGHSYSRAKVKFNIHRVDNMIIHTIGLMDQLDKDINTFSMRIREWYGYHFPELIKIIPDNHMYAKVTKILKNRKELPEEKLEALEETVMDSAVAQAIVDASKSSMGMDINMVDLMNIEIFADRVISLGDYRERLAQYLRSKMSGVAPNLASLIGDQTGARLIAHAGSLTNLAKFPASTVQILGAEKALFRALKTRGNTPKFGLLFNSTFIGRANARDKGRISRYLANKCSMASRLDCFLDVPTNVFGEKLRQQVEDRLKFFETGEIPQKNIDVMKEALKESLVSVEQDNEESPKKKKKDKKRKNDVLENGKRDDEYIKNGDTEQTDVPKKKKKSKSISND